MFRRQSGRTLSPVSRKRRLTRDESKARTRAELLRAADRLFMRKGFVATSLAEIAEEAALTKGAVYSNFASKEELFLAVLEEYEAKRERDEQDEGPYAIRAAGGATPSDRARAFGRQLADAQPKRRFTALFLEMNAFALRDDRARRWVAEHNQAFFERFGAELAELLDAAEEDAELLGLLAQSLYVGLQMHAAFRDEPLDAATHERLYGALAAFARTPDPA
jgi:AcrR family transcriptional regulator